MLLTTVTFAEAGGQTRLRLTWVPHEASEAEIACFAAAIGGADKGWAAGMELLAKLLVELQAETHRRTDGALTTEPSNSAQPAVFGAAT